MSFPSTYYILKSEFRLQSYDIFKFGQNKKCLEIVYAHMLGMNILTVYTHSHSKRVQFTSFEISVYVVIITIVVVLTSQVK